jgi:death on curing protein
VTEPTWLPVEEIIETNRYEVAKTGERHFLRDLGLLTSASDRPKNLYYYGGETDIATLASSLLFAIARNHPFEQGNKRTGFQSAFQLLDLNGYDLTVPNVDEVADSIVSVLERKIAEEQFIEHFKQYVLPIEDE